LHKRLINSIKIKKMDMAKQSVYILFDGTAKEAMEFYHLCLGGHLQITSVGESPMKALFPVSFHNKTLNGRLQSEFVDISTSDWLKPDETPIRGNMNCLYISGGTVESTTKIFEKLSDGANVTDPLRVEPFGTYGALNDKFGLRWMFHAE
jgi:PhnB protein